MLIKSGLRTGPPTHLLLSVSIQLGICSQLSLTEVPITAHNISSNAPAEIAQTNSEIRTDDKTPKPCYIWSLNAFVMLAEVMRGKMWWNIYSTESVLWPSLAGNPRPLCVQVIVSYFFCLHKVFIGITKLKTRRNDCLSQLDWTVIKILWYFLACYSKSLPRWFFFSKLVSMHIHQSSGHSYNPTWSHRNSQLFYEAYSMNLYIVNRTKTSKLVKSDTEAPPLTSQNKSY